MLWRVKLLQDRRHEKVLLVGESWVSSSTHYKGFDQFGSVTFHTGNKRFMEGMKGGDYDVTHLPAHEAAADFPTTLEGLSQFDVIILSDIGANTLLLHPDVWLRGERVPNRVNLLADWTRQGGGLIMIGGYFSFQGSTVRLVGTTLLSKRLCQLPA